MKSRLAAHWADIVFALLLCAAASWYFGDVLQASSSVGNLMLILPVFLAAAVLLITVIAGYLRRERGDAQPSWRLFANSDAARQMIVLGLLAAYILSLPFFYFDAATAIFIFLTMLTMGRKRLLLALAFSIVAAAAITYAFAWLLPYYPFPTLLV